MCLISTRYSAIFIHVPKVAGTSVKKCLRKSDFRKIGINHNIPASRKHRNEYFLKGATPRLKEGFDLKKIQDHTWTEFFKFAFVRNPWDRMVSSWSYLKRKTGRTLEFNEFVHQYPYKNIFWDWHTQPQYIHLVNENTNELMVDYVGKFENLQSDLNYIGNNLGINADLTLPTVNKSNHRTYKEYYDSELIDVVGEIFKEDIRRFGYEFGE